ncbi:hypothetical protein PoB_006944900 [Plakobranchus ocellatus]|uniref:Uncharacterized protein n=1 Tax=Plakobranchus ocellatus TaxID=259542 RepID=A0AAV4DFR1_9GAST|nr:hypothetical protein PoB_006944900 [Plakobranchus ocellatus]
MLSGGGGAQTCSRRIPADLSKGSLSTEPPKLHHPQMSGQISLSVENFSSVSVLLPLCVCVTISNESAQKSADAFLSRVQVPPCHPRPACLKCWLFLQTAL